jgi:hypothetical protein
MCGQIWHFLDVTKENAHRITALVKAFDHAMAITPNPMSNSKHDASCRAPLIPSGLPRVLKKFHECDLTNTITQCSVIVNDTPQSPSQLLRPVELVLRFIRRIVLPPGMLRRG